MPQYVAKLKRTGSRSEDASIAHVDVAEGQASGEITVTEGGIEAFTDIVLRDWFGYSSGGHIEANPATQSAGLVDDYSYWAANGEDCHAGKLHLMCDTDLDRRIDSTFL